MCMCIYIYIYIYSCCVYVNRSCVHRGNQGGPKEWGS